MDLFWCCEFSSSLDFFLTKELWKLTYLESLQYLMERYFQNTHFFKKRSQRLAVFDYNEKQVSFDKATEIE